MINPLEVNKPVKRGAIRKYLGKEFFILKRQLHWLFGNESFAKVDSKIICNHSFIKHQSTLLRPLKNVDMYLQHNKVINLKIAIKQLNKVVIKPGQTFSIWYLVGRPSKFKGYHEGMALHNGKISKDIGGGLCQLGNLIYWMALHTPLKIVERWRHSFDVFPDINRTIPFACGATLAYNYIDLQLKNDTNNTFQINLWLDNEHLHGEIMCNAIPNAKYEIYETNHLIHQQWWGGYTRHNKIWKKITNLVDHKISEELIAENNAIMMYNPLLNQ
jgi:vancomycin resistance protein VanW